MVRAQKKYERPTTHRQYWQKNSLGLETFYFQDLQLNAMTLVLFPLSLPLFNCL